MDIFDSALKNPEPPNKHNEYSTNNNNYSSENINPDNPNNPNINPNNNTLNPNTYHTNPNIINTNINPNNQNFNTNPNINNPNIGPNSDINHNINHNYYMMQSQLPRALPTLPPLTGGAYPQMVDQLPLIQDIGVSKDGTGNGLIGKKKRKKNSRRKHRNSHLGCGTCKKRRIKCDETLPACLNCLKGKLHCAYLNLDSTGRNALRMAQYNQNLRQDKLDQPLKKDKDSLLDQNTNTNSPSDILLKSTNNSPPTLQVTTHQLPTHPQQLQQVYSTGPLQQLYSIVQQLPPGAAPPPGAPQTATVIQSPYGPLVTLQPILANGGVVYTTAPLGAQPQAIPIQLVQAPPQPQHQPIPTHLVTEPVPSQMPTQMASGPVLIPSGAMPMALIPNAMSGRTYAEVLPRGKEEIALPPISAKSTSYTDLKAAERLAQYADKSPVLTNDMIQGHSPSDQPTSSFSNLTISGRRDEAIRLPSIKSLTTSSSDNSNNDATEDKVPSILKLLS